MQADIKQSRVIECPSRRNRVSVCMQSFESMILFSQDGGTEQKKLLVSWSLLAASTPEASPPYIAPPEPSEFTRLKSLW
jgi:hypothetical protein